MGSAEDLYIKMNSRGKPLTEFENFKARFEKTLDWSPRARRVRPQGRRRVGGPAVALRGDDDIVDDEFLRYFAFVTEVCEWRRGDTEARDRPLITAPSGRSAPDDADGGREP